MTATTATARPASIRLSARLNGALNQHAKQLKVSKDALVRRAIAEMLEAAEIEARRKEKGIPWSQAKAELGL